ncbi:hypothetical protein FOA52_012499 [Chlamydomonas sp. UWO 241]|nr:hypothetical protein FOA52_012499 [Chlamydomonas sp. UWO 241]
MHDVLDADVTEVVARCEDNVPSGPYGYHGIGWRREVRPIPTRDLRRWAGNLEELTLRFWEREWVLSLCGKHSTPLPKLRLLSVVHTESYDRDHIWGENTWNAEVWKAPLKGLAVASQLTRLVLSSPLVVDVTFIRACKQLELVALKMECHGFSSLEGLSALSQLRSLVLEMDTWRQEHDSLDLDVLTSLSGLTRLGLLGFTEDLSWLPSCTSLEVLDLEDRCGQCTTIESFGAVLSCSPALRCIKFTKEPESSCYDSWFDALWAMGFVPLESPDLDVDLDVVWVRAMDVDDLMMEAMLMDDDMMMEAMIMVDDTMMEAMMEAMNAGSGDDDGSSVGDDGSGGSSSNDDDCGVGGAV